jgi:hypothetical protein
MRVFLAGEQSILFLKYGFRLKSRRGGERRGEKKKSVAEKELFSDV